MPEITRAESSRAAHVAGQRQRSDRPGGSDDAEPDSESSSEEDGSEDEEDEEGEEEDEESGEESSSQVSTIRTRSGITYDLTNLDTESGAKALLGLTGHFEVVNCGTSSTGYSFQLLDRPRVHIGPGKSPTCTCTTFQSHPNVACHHIFVSQPRLREGDARSRSSSKSNVGTDVCKTLQWLLDQLHSCFFADPASTELALSHDGRPSMHPQIEELLSGKFEAVADRLNWPCLRAEGDERRTGMTRAEKVRDVLSAFSPKVLPEDFRRDLVETTAQSRTPEQCVVQGDLEATIFRLAVHDDSVFTSICKAMPSGACAVIYFDKIQEQLRRLLADFDRYCTTGETTAESVSPGRGLFEVDEVVQQLRRSVSLIHANIALRAPYGSEGAAKALVFILEAVAARNKDALEGNTWGRASFHGEDEDQRNLYHILIGSDDMDLETDSELFVLDALNALPPAELTLHLPKLLEIRSKIEVNRAPKQYLIRLGALIRVVEAASAASSSGMGQMGSGQKRPAASNPYTYSKRSR
ncbi:hypothetical protein N7539_002993 [Penicillium diatomitis]|uniref:SWIM-type domain-containing protein n=1 Tax=Penicillium diatomitis TaxID=2819901 RepID=A0A9X0BZ81_9EURO|nr:uncharacterized protein N7539_002993 [Penicillium diatomitis]KAJ5491426.1 hypothetical protein N7539_002993 [Penicillium diatomitis]